MQMMTCDMGKKTLEKKDKRPFVKLDNATNKYCMNIQVHASTIIKVIKIPKAIDNEWMSILDVMVVWRKIEKTQTTKGKKQRII